MYNKLVGSEYTNYAQSKHLILMRQENEKPELSMNKVPTKKLITILLKGTHQIFCNHFSRTAFYLMPLNEMNQLTIFE